MSDKGINPALRNFFFFAIKSNKDYKRGEKEMGKINTVSFYISEEKNIMRTESATDHRDMPLTAEDIEKMCQLIRVKKETIAAAKNILVEMDMNAKKIYVQENKKDGTTQNTVI